MLPFQGAVDMKVFTVTFFCAFGSCTSCFPREPRPCGMSGRHAGPCGSVQPCPAQALQPTPQRPEATRTERDPRRGAAVGAGRQPGLTLPWSLPPCSPICPVPARIWELRPEPAGTKHVFLQLMGRGPPALRQALYLLSSKPISLNVHLTPHP